MDQSGRPASPASSGSEQAISDFDDEDFDAVDGSDIQTVGPAKSTAPPAQTRNVLITSTDIVQPVSESDDDTNITVEDSLDNDDPVPVRPRTSVSAKGSGVSVTLESGDFDDSET
jgi:hypothetical protein